MAPPPPAAADDKERVSCCIGFKKSNGKISTHSNVVDSGKENTGLVDDLLGRHFVEARILNRIGQENRQDPVEKANFSVAIYNAIFEPNRDSEDFQVDDVYYLRILWDADYSLLESFPNSTATLKLLEDLKDHDAKDLWFESTSHLDDTGSIRFLTENLVFPHSTNTIDNLEIMWAELRIYRVSKKQIQDNIDIKEMTEMERAVSTDKFHCGQCRINLKVLSTGPIAVSRVTYYHDVAALTVVCCEVIILLRCISFSTNDQHLTSYYSII